MNKLCIVAVLCALSVGCKDELTRELSRVADQACACQDRVCAETARAQLDSVLDTMTKPPKANATRIAALISKASACIDDASDR